VADCDDANAAINPAVAEACNAADDDCDGATDEDFPALGQACDGADGDLCDEGAIVCSIAGGTECSDASATDVEACNAADDDCDGATDEDFPALGQACDGADADECATGAFTCTADGSGVECINETGEPVAEVCDGADNDCNGIVDDAATVIVRADHHTIGTGSHPGSTKTPLGGLTVGIFDKAEGSCARVICGGISWQHYACIASNCDPVAVQTTDSSGQTTFALAPGDYLVIGSDGTDKHLGVSASDVTCGILMRKYLQQMETANGKTHPGKTSVRTGSELLVIEPEYVEWTATQELYPFVFESLGDWSVTTSVAPPEGFVADHDSLAAEVTTESEAVQFTITDVGSDWVPTHVKHRVQHGARREVLLSRIGVSLDGALASAKGVDRAGRPLDAEGRPGPEAGFDPRSLPPVELLGWVEPSAADVEWSVKFRVNTATQCRLAITDENAGLVRLLVNGRFHAGDHAVPWDGLDRRGRGLGTGRYYLTLSSEVVQESVPLGPVGGDKPSGPRPE
jgi:hypothetical protein